MRLSIRLTAAMVLVVGVITAGCSTDEEPARVPQVNDGQPDQAAAALQRLTSAIDQGQTGDLPAGDSQVGDRRVPESVTYAKSVLANARTLEIERFSARFVATDAEASQALPSGQWAGSVEISWRMPAISPALVSTDVMMVFAEARGRAVPVGLLNSGEPSPLWLVERVRVLKSPRVLVLSAADREAAWKGGHYLTFGRRAVPTVDAAIPGWDDPLLLEVPSDPQDFDTLLGTPARSYSGIAAVTAAVEDDGSDRSPMRVVINPGVMNGLTRRGAQVVITHESVHAAMADPADAASPRWLIEGYADHVALRGIEVSESRKASRIIAQVRRGGAPDALPTDKQLASGAEGLEATYESAWMVCVVIADEVGESELLRLRRLVASGTSLDRALQDVVGWDRAELTRRWRMRLQELAR